jgi:hypothetical protein
MTDLALYATARTAHGGLPTTLPLAQTRRHPAPVGKSAHGAGHCVSCLEHGADLDQQRSLKLATERVHPQRTGLQPARHCTSGLGRGTLGISRNGAGELPTSARVKTDYVSARSHICR